MISSFRSSSASSSRANWRLSRRYVTRPRRCSIALAWSTTSSNVMGGLPMQGRVMGRTARVRQAPASSAQVSGLDEMVERGAGDAENFGDRRFRDRFGQEGLNLCLPARELRRPKDAFGPARQPPLGSGRRQAFFGALGDQISLYFRKQTQ